MSGLDEVYRERAHLLALLATHYPAHIQPDATDYHWPVLILRLPTGQCAWHISESDMDLFDHVRTDTYEPWDGHTTYEKYERIREWTNLRS